MEPKVEIPNLKRWDLVRKLGILVSCVPAFCHLRRRALGTHPASSLWRRKIWDFLGQKC